MRTRIASVILLGLVSAATVAGQQLPPPRPWTESAPQADIVPVAKVQPLAPTQLPPPSMVPTAPPLPPGISLPGTVPGMPPGVVPGMSPMMPEGAIPNMPFGLPSGDMHPDGPSGPESPEGSTYPLSRFWLTADYLHWWFRGNAAPPIITTGKTTDALPGVIGQTNTTIIGGNITDTASRDGIRLNFAFALEQSWLSSVEANFLYVPRRFTHFFVAQPNNVIIARPFFNEDTQSEDAFIVSSPGGVQGSVTATGITELWGGELNFRVRQMHSPGFFIHYLGGLRFAQLNDALRISEASTNDGSDPTRADILFRTDSFVSRNYFFGPQVGLELEWVTHEFSFNINGKLAAGLTQEDMYISGATQGETFSGRFLPPINFGFLTAPTNIGTFAQGRVGILGELGFTAAYQFTPNWRVAVGYTVLYWNRVLRANQQIDRTLNSTVSTNTGVASQLVGDFRPAFGFHESEFWAQGVNFTIEFRY
jgi:hypothetical protein